MKKTFFTLLCLSLCACFGGNSSTGPQGPIGHQGPQGTPGKSAYEIWLDAGNSGSEQDFLDSLINKGSESSDDAQMPYFRNTKEYIDYYSNIGNSIYTPTETTKPMGTQGTYKEYSYIQHLYSPSAAQNVKYTYNEKELVLGNYGVYITQYQKDVKNDFQQTYPRGYIHNREGVGNNVYTPQAGSVFTGGTLAYLYKDDTTTDPTIIHGTSKFTYNPTNPSVELHFADYYDVKFSQTGTNKYNIDIAGNNSTGKSEYNLPTGTFENKNATIETGHLSKNGIQESFGTYTTTFRDNDFGNTRLIENSFNFTGAFGGTKQ